MLSRYSMLANTWLLNSSSILSPMKIIRSRYCTWTVQITYPCTARKQSYVHPKKDIISVIVSYQSIPYVKPLPGSFTRCSVRHPWSTNRHHRNAGSGCLLVWQPTKGKFAEHWDEKCAQQTTSGSFYVFLATQMLYCYLKYPLLLEEAYQVISPIVNWQSDRSAHDVILVWKQNSSVSVSVNNTGLTTTT